jgi:hypothetical protein
MAADAFHCPAALVGGTVIESLSKLVSGPLRWSTDRGPELGMAAGLREFCTPLQTVANIHKPCVSPIESSD